MEYVLLTTAWLVASVLFILSLRGLSSQETARKGNLYGIIGMAIAVGSTAMASVIDVYVPLVLALGAALTACRSSREVELPPKPTRPLGRSIVIAGERFDVGTPVILWTD